MSIRKCAPLPGSILLLFFLPLITTAQIKKKRKGEFYLSWGYNTEWYTRSTVKIYQPELGNSFRFINVKGHDHPGWNEGLFSKALSIPQYNYRIGYFFNDHHFFYPVHAGMVSPETGFVAEYRAGATI